MSIVDYDTLGVKGNSVGALRMTQWYQRYKPATSVRTQLATAAFMWTAVGASLLTVGVLWCRSDSPIHWVALSFTAAVGGLLKARLVLRKAAARIIKRIITRGDGCCLGGFISWQTWIMVAIMMLLGRSLRHGLLPRPAVGFIYVAVGVALLVGAITLWSSLARDTSDTPPAGSVL